MIRYTKGNLLETQAEALVNTVNTVGVMGKGVALMFKEAFPENFRAYQKACKNNEVQVGRMFVTTQDALMGPRWIINFPTKEHWRSKTRVEWVERGLEDLRRVVEEEGIRSIALPPLGCGNGGLAWDRVRPLIEEYLGRLDDIEIIVHEPTREYQNVRKRTGVEALTPARALIVDLIRRYSLAGPDCSILEIQKLAWFLESRIRDSGMRDPLDLRYQANRYGPYADRLTHLLNSLDGSYLQCDKRLADAGPMDLIRFNPDKEDRVSAYLRSDEGSPYVPLLEATDDLIDGFQSPMGLELLATVDWLLREEGCAPDVRSVREALAQWPGGETAGRRKLDLFDERLLGLALEHLHRNRDNVDRTRATTGLV